MACMHHKMDVECGPLPRSERNTKAETHVQNEDVICSQALCGSTDCEVAQIA